MAEKPRPLRVVEIDSESVDYLHNKYGWETVRPEQLSIAQFVELTNAVGEYLNKNEHHE